MNSLYDLIDIRTIMTNYEARDKDDAIRFAGNLLLENGIIERRYIEAMIKISNMYDAYIVLLPGLAIPHAKPEDGALKVGFSLVTLRNSVEFGNKVNDPVKLIIAVSSSGKNEHLALMSGLGKVLQDKNLIDSIVNAKNKEEVYNILKSKAKSIE